MSERELAAQRVRQRSGEGDVDELPDEARVAGKIDDAVVIGAAGEFALSNPAPTIARAHPR